MHTLCNSEDFQPNKKDFGVHRESKELLICFLSQFRHWEAACGANGLKVNLLSLLVKKYLEKMAQEWRSHDLARECVHCMNTSSSHCPQTKAEFLGMLRRRGTVSGDYLSTQLRHTWISYSSGEWRRKRRARVSSESTWRSTLDAGNYVSFLRLRPWKREPDRHWESLNFPFMHSLFLCSFKNIDILLCAPHCTSNWNTKINKTHMVSSLIKFPI